MATTIPTQYNSLRRLDAVLFHLPPQGVIADPEFLRGTTPIPLAIFEYFPDVVLLHSFHTHIARALR